MSREIVNPKVGQKVVSGPKWIWGSQSKGSEYGVITDVGDDGWLSVQWVDKHGMKLDSYGYTWKEGELLYYEEPVDTSQKLHKVNITLLRDAYDASQDRGCEWHNTISNIIASTPPAIILDGKAFVEEKYIRAFFDDSTICESWRNRIKSELPEVTKNILSNYLKFTEITGDTCDQGIFIAKGMAKNKDDVDRVILVDSRLEVEVIHRYNNTNRTGIKFKIL